MHLTAYGLQPSAVRCIRPPRPWVFQHSSLARSLSLYQIISPALLQSLYIHSPEFIMNYKVTFFKAWYHGKAPTCARLSYMKLKLNNRAFQKCMVELAPQYETDQPSGSRTISANQGCHWHPFFFSIRSLTFHFSILIILIQFWRTALIEYFHMFHTFLLEFARILRFSPFKDNESFLNIFWLNTSVSIRNSC